MSTERETPITATNVESVYTRAMIESDEITLERVYRFLRNEGWAGGISVDEAIAAVLRESE